MITWIQSGKGDIHLGIGCVRELAISSGYLFEGERDIAKAANLGGTFQTHLFAILERNNA